MTQSDGPKTLFCGQGVSFDDIAVRKELGGPAALMAYLKTRRAMCARALATAAAMGEDVTLLQVGVRSFDEAISLLTVGKVRKSPDRIKAMGPRNLLGLKL